CLPHPQCVLHPSLREAAGSEASKARSRGRGGVVGQGVRALLWAPGLSKPPPPPPPPRHALRARGEGRNLPRVHRQAAFSPPGAACSAAVVSTPSIYLR